MIAPKLLEKLDTTLTKGLQILEALARDGQARGVTDLANELGLTKSNVFRLLQTLAALGYVRQGADKTYAATLKSWQVGRGVVEALNLRELAAPEMQALARNTGEAVYLAIPEGLEVVYVDKIDGSRPIRSWNPVGGTAPIHCAGTGKAILAANYARMRDRLADELPRYTDRTITSLAALDADMAVTQARGYAVDAGEYRDQVHSFGAAILLPDGEAVAAIGVSVPDVNLPEDGVARIGELVRAAADAVSDRLARF